MTSADRLQRDLPRLLTELVEPPLPRDIDAILTRTASVRQRPSWAILDRWHPMADTYLKYAAAAAAVVVLAVAGFTLFGTQSGRPAGEISPPTSVAPSPTPPWTSEACQFLCGAGPLTAGIHTSGMFEPAFTYALATDWVNLEDGDVYLLYPDTPANRALAAAGDNPPQLRISSDPIRIVPDARVTGSPSDNAVCEDDRPGDSPTLSGSFEVNAAKFHEYLGTLEGVTTTVPITVTVSGLTGRQIDVVPEPGSMTCLPGTSFAAVTVQADRYRYIVLDNPEGDSLLITLWAPTDFDAFLSAAMPVVESMQFDMAP